MEYNLYNELVKALGSKFQESMKDFSSLKQYISLRLGNLVYRDGSIQHYGTSHSIFYLRDVESNKIYQGFWDLEREILTIGPVTSFNSGEDGALIKVSGKKNHVSFIQRKDDEIIIEKLQEENGISANTKIYSNDIWHSTHLESIEFISSCCNALPDYEFGLKKDEITFVLDTFTSVGEVLKDWHTCYSNENNAQAVSTYFEKMDKELTKMKSTAFQKKKTIQDSH